MKGISEREKFVCPKCNSTNFDLITSSTNFAYEYCTKCKFNLKEAKKQVELDSIFKYLADYLKNNQYKNLNIELIKNSDSLELVINGSSILNHNFTYEISNKDIYFIENTVFELVEDITKDLNIESNIIICA